MTQLGVEPTVIDLSAYVQSDQWETAIAGQVILLIEKGRQDQAQNLLNDPTYRQMLEPAHVKQLEAQIKTKIN